MKNFKIWTFVALAGLGIFSACEKNEFDLPVETSPAGARVRFVSTAFNLTDANAGALLLNVGAANNLINGNQRITYASGTFPNVGYAVLPGGNTEITFNRAAYGIQRTGRRDSVYYTDSVLARSTFNFEAGKYYTVFLTDSSPNLGMRMITDEFTNGVDTSGLVRFVNMYTKNGIKNDTIEFVRRRDGVVMATGLTFGQASSFIPTPALRADTFFIRPARSTMAAPGWGQVLTTGLTRGRNFTVGGCGSTSRGIAATRPFSYTNH